MNDKKPVSFYDRMKTGVVNWKREDAYLHRILDYMCEIFRIDNLPDSMRKDAVLQTMFMHGLSCTVLAGSGIEKGSLVHVPCVYSDLIKTDNTADHIIYYTNDYSAELPTECVALLHNSASDYPEWDVYRYANQLASIDKVQRSLIKRANYGKVPVAYNQTEQKTLEALLKSISDGLETPVCRRIPIPDVATETGATIDLTDPDMLDKANVLSFYHTEIVKRIACLYGMNFHSTSKQAQATIDEVNGMNQFADIGITQKLRYLREWAVRCNQLYGTKISVDFSDLWKKQQEAAENDASRTEEEMEVTETESAEETSSESDELENSVGEGEPNEDS